MPSVVTWVTPTQTLPLDCPHCPSCEPLHLFSTEQLEPKLDLPSLLQKTLGFPQGDIKNSLTQARSFLHQPSHLRPITLNFLWNDKLSLTLDFPTPPPLPRLLLQLLTLQVQNRTEETLGSDCSRPGPNTALTPEACERPPAPSLCPSHLSHFIRSSYFNCAFLHEIVSCDRVGIWLSCLAVF